MNALKPILTFISAVLLLLVCGQVVAKDESVKASAKLVLDVYKSPTCGCCKKWMKHLNANEIATTGHFPADLYSFKVNKGIAGQYQSCHTAVSPNGYVFEGHIPAKYIQQFLAAPPEDAIGLSVPAMPVGSPGMEYQDRFMPYRVLLLNKDGSSATYAEVRSAKEQY